MKPERQCEDRDPLKVSGSGVREGNGAEGNGGCAVIYTFFILSGASLWHQGQMAGWRFPITLLVGKLLHVRIYPRGTGAGPDCAPRPIRTKWGLLLPWQLPIASVTHGSSAALFIRLPPERAFLLAGLCPWRCTYLATSELGPLETTMSGRRSILVCRNAYTPKWISGRDPLPDALLAPGQPAFLWITLCISRAPGTCATIGTECFRFIQAGNTSRHSLTRCDNFAGTLSTPHRTRHAEARRRVVTDTAIPVYDPTIRHASSTLASVPAPQATETAPYLPQPASPFVSIRL